MFFRECILKVYQIKKVGSSVWWVSHARQDVSLCNIENLNGEWFAEIEVFTRVFSCLAAVAICNVLAVVPWASKLPNSRHFAGFDRAMRPLGVQGGLSGPVGGGG